MTDTDLLPPSVDPNTSALGIRRVVAHTLLDHDGSIGVLEKQNFVDSGQVPGPGIRRYVLDLQND